MQRKWKPSESTIATHLPPGELPVCPRCKSDRRVVRMSEGLARCTRCDLAIEGEGQGKSEVRGRRSER